LGYLGSGLNKLKFYNKFDFFQGPKPLKKVLKNLEKNYFKISIDIDNLRNLYHRKGNFEALFGP